MLMIQDNPNNKRSRQENEDAGIQPDPETLGPEPQEHMKGPVSSLVRKVEKTMNENDQDEEIDEEKDK